MSWSPRHVDEPDYEKRVAAYMSAKLKIEVLETNEKELAYPLNLDYALLVLHIAAFDIQKVFILLSQKLLECVKKIEKIAV